METFPQTHRSAFKPYPGCREARFGSCPRGCVTCRVLPYLRLSLERGRLLPTTSRPRSAVLAPEKQTCVEQLGWHYAPAWWRSVVMVAPGHQRFVQLVSMNSRGRRTFVSAVNLSTLFHLESWGQNRTRGSRSAIEEIIVELGSSIFQLETGPCY